MPPAPQCSFASDNAAGVLPEVLDAMVAANEGCALAYGEDPWTTRAESALADLFGGAAAVALCWGGTGANVVGLACLLGPGEAVICAEEAHIAVDEGGAPERFTGSKLLTVPTPDGKLRPDDVLAVLYALGNQHHAQPGVVSITQSTERGTLYRPDEIAAVAEVAHDHGLHVHLDGARIANAAAALDGDLRSFTTDAGVDVVSFGGTKNGLMYGDAVVVLEPAVARVLPFVRKQTTQLASKMRFLGAQFEALLADDLWLRTAGHANAMARRLADRLDGVQGVQVTGTPDVNATFVQLPSAAAVAELQAWSFVWEWEPARHEIRAMTSFATTIDDVDRFAAGIAAVAAQHG
nr:aminotransferase class I/II-fold pyridoxal phosphate-dependent enzyme [Rhabdothermincola salaria]